MWESKLFEEPFVVVCVWKFFMQGVPTKIQTFGGFFLLEFGLFSRERGGGNGDRIENILRNLYSLCLDGFHEILGRMSKIQTFLRNFSLSKIRFCKNFLKEFQNYRGEGHLYFFQTKRDFLWWLPLGCEVREICKQIHIQGIDKYNISKPKTKTKFGPPPKKSLNRRKKNKKI